MIIDFKADRWNALRHDVICARTGEALRGLHIWYADDVEGIVRCYIRDESGGFVRNSRGDGILWEERRKAIKIVPADADWIAQVDEMEREFSEGAAQLKTLVETVDELKYGEAPR